MPKRKFRVDTGRYGGELSIGKVDKEFVEYWRGKDEADLIDFVTSLDWGDPTEDQNCSIPCEGFNAWHECDDKEHLNNAYADGDWRVTEVTDEEDEWAYNDTEKEFKPGQHLYGREAYPTDIDEWDFEQVDLELYDPVLCFHSAEKGGFSSYYIETDGEDFDPKKLTFSSVETYLGDILENVWYDKQEVEANFDYNDTTGKGYHASVGYMNKKWHDDPATFVANIDEYYQEVA